MKTQILFMVIFSFSCFQSFSQWEWKNPVPAGNVICDMQAIDSLHVWAVGYAGMILVTSDGGDTWRVQPSGCNDILVAVSFTDSLHGWTCGLEGTLLRTTNGGKTWNKSQFPKRGLYDISFVDSLNGWLAVKFSKRLYKTIDGGFTWDTIPVIFSDGFTQVCFLDLNHGWAGNYNGLVTHTHDGGQTWQPMQSSAAWYLKRLTFTDTLNGFIVDSSPKFITTIDGGHTWIKKPIPQISEKDIFFLDKNNGWAVGYDYNSVNNRYEGRIARTKDGGNTFSIFKLNEAWNLYSVTFFDTLRGWIADNTGVIYATHDGGMTWTKQSQSYTNEDLSGIFPLKNSHTAWSVGSYGCILKTEDDGTTWAKQESHTGMYLVSVFFTDKNNGIAVGNAAPILKTQDGGAHWDSVTRPVNYYLRKVIFTSNSTGWITAHRAILKTMDGGTKWEVSYSPSFDLDYDFLDIIFTDSLHGYGVGYVYNGGDFLSLIIRTSDGGVNWTEQLRSNPTELRSVSFTDNNHGWACGTEGYIIRTQDGGMTWDSVQFWDKQSNLNSVCFTDSLNGWIAGEYSVYGQYNGLILRTTDGGNTWIEQNSGVGHTLSAVSFSDSTFGYAVGNLGTIISWGKNVVGIKDENFLANHYLIGNYPNPVDKLTTIQYILKHPSNISLKIYNLSASVVATLVDSFQSEGKYCIPFDTSDIPSGIYFYRISSKNQVETKKMVILH